MTTTPPITAGVTPKRIQRKRTKGYRLPSTAVYVGRPTRWGNPFSVEEHGRERAIALYQEHMAALKEQYQAEYQALLEPLRGKDLACWCRLDQACHADLLLELVNQDLTS